MDPFNSSFNEKEWPSLSSPTNSKNNNSMKSTASSFQPSASWNGWDVTPQTSSPLSLSSLIKTNNTEEKELTVVKRAPIQVIQKKNSRRGEKINLGAIFKTETAVVESPEACTRNFGVSQNISTRFFGAQEVASQNFDKIKFSQKTVSDFNRGEVVDLPIDELASKMFLGFDKKFAIDVVDNEDGTFTSIDNRRLIIAKRIASVDPSYTIFIKVHKPSEMTYRVGPKMSWREAVNSRMETTKVNGFTGEPTIMNGMNKAKSQKVSFEVDSIDMSALDSQTVQSLNKLKDLSGYVNV